MQSMTTVAIPNDPSGQVNPSFGRLLAYSAPALPLAVMLIPLNALLPIFYTQALGLSLATVGTALLASRLLDVLIDPVIGTLTDRTRSRFGARRPWLVAGTPIMMGGAVLLFAPIGSVSGAYLFAASSIVYLGWSAIQIPYQAWGGESVTSYHGRSRVTSFRETMSFVGVMLAGAVPTAAGWFGHGIDRVTMATLGGIIAVALPITVAVSLRSLPQRPPSATHGARLSDVLEVLRWNRPFLIIVISFVAIGLAKGIMNSLTAYYITYYLQMPQLVGVFLLVSYVGVLIGVRLWLFVSRRFSKHIAVSCSLAIALPLSLGSFHFLKPGDGVAFLVIELFMGIGVAGYLILPPAIVADAADYFHFRFAKERFGVHYAIWNIVQKLMQALAVGIALPLVEWLGFRPGQETSPSVLFNLKTVFFIVPLPLLAAGVLLNAFFPIGPARHSVIRRALLRREARKNVGHGLISAAEA